MPYPSWPGRLARRRARPSSPAERLHQGNRRLRREAEDLRAGLERPPALADEHAQGTEPEPAGYAPLRMLPFFGTSVIITLGPLEFVAAARGLAAPRGARARRRRRAPPSTRRCCATWPSWRGAARRWSGWTANLGHLAIWRGGLLERLGIDSEYVYTDPDVVPAESCPPDLVGRLQYYLG